MEVDDYKHIFENTKKLKTLIQTIEDSCLEYLTAFVEPETTQNKEAKS